MTKMNRFFASVVLIASLSTIGLADGGATQGPSIYSDPPTVAPESMEESSQLLDALKTAESVTVWLLTEVF